MLRDIEAGGERNRGLYVLKSRGMAHSNQIREFLITSDGIELQDVYVGPEGVLTGSLRAAQEGRERAAALAHERDARRRAREIERRRVALQGQIEALQDEVRSLEDEREVADSEYNSLTTTVENERAAAAARRGADATR